MHWPPSKRKPLVFCNDSAGRKILREEKNEDTTEKSKTYS